MSVLVAIPARGGSKGVPHKNLRMLEGKPLVSYAIDLAKDLFPATDIFVSTDSPEICAIAAKSGVAVHKRDASLASDTSPVTDTVAAVLTQAKAQNNKQYAFILLLQPTAPFRETYHVREALQALISAPHVQSLISVCESRDIHPDRMYKIEDGLLTPVNPRMEVIRRQEVPPAYFRNGAIYLVRTEAFEKEHSLMCKPSMPYVMDSKFWVNIDEPRDFIMAAALMKAYKEGTL